MDQDGPLGGVGKTALGMALVRAQESRREDRLFDDPYAQAFADAASGAFSAETAAAGERVPGGPLARLCEVFAFHAVIRTRFFDDYLIAAAAAGCRQVVLLAAGLDSRAFQLRWPAGTRLFEVDLPDVTGFKETVLARLDAKPACERIVIPADLRGPWPARLSAAGFDRGNAHGMARRGAAALPDRRGGRWPARRHRGTVCPGQSAVLRARHHRRKRPAHPGQDAARDGSVRRAAEGRPRPGRPPLTRPVPRDATGC